MRKSQSESGILPQMYSDSSGNDIAGTDGKPRRIFQKKDLIEAVRRLSPGRGTPGMKKKMASNKWYPQHKSARKPGKARLHYNTTCIRNRREHACTEIQRIKDGCKCEAKGA